MLVFSCPQTINGRSFTKTRSPILQKPGIMRVGAAVATRPFQRQGPDMLSAKISTA